MQINPNSQSSMSKEVKFAEKGAENTAATINTNDKVSIGSSKLDDPFGSNPFYNNPMTNNPMTNNPMTNNPMTNNPMTNNPMTNNPMTGGIFKKDDSKAGNEANSIWQGMPGNHEPGCVTNHPVQTGNIWQGMPGQPQPGCVTHPQVTGKN